MCVRISSQNISDFHRFPGFHGSINQVGRSQIVSRIRHGFSKKKMFPWIFPNKVAQKSMIFPWPWHAMAAMAIRAAVLPWNKCHIASTAALEVQFTSERGCSRAKWAMLIAVLSYLHLSQVILSYLELSQAILSYLKLSWVFLNYLIYIIWCFLEFSWVTSSYLKWYDVVLSYRIFS